MFTSCSLGEMREEAWDMVIRIGLVIKPIKALISGSYDPTISSPGPTFESPNPIVGPSLFFSFPYVCSVTDSIFNFPTSLQLSSYFFSLQPFLPYFLPPHFCFFTLFPFPSLPLSSWFFFIFLFLLSLSYPNFPNSLFLSSLPKRSPWNFSWKRLLES